MSNISVFSLLRQLSCQRDAARMRLSVDISCTQGAQQQTRRPPLLLSIDGTDRQTDARPLHRPCSAYNADSVNNVTLIHWPLVGVMLHLVLELELERGAHYQQERPQHFAA